MNLILCLLLSSLLSSLVAAAQPKQTIEEQMQKAKYRREAMLEQSEIKYHKKLHQEQEKLVAAMRRPEGSFIEDTPTNPEDRAAVEALYQSTNGPKWVNNTGWMKGEPCTYPFWFGLYCIEGRVIQINLVYNGLDGSIPSDLARATSLQVLRLYNNILTGEIPSQIFALQSLQILDVNTNSISGSLPPEINMPNLTQLALYSNNIKGYFPRSFSAPNLQIFEVSTNALTGELPSGLSESVMLTDFVVSRNALTGTLPSSYGKLVNMQRLWTFYNNFNQFSIPDTYSTLVNLLNVEMDGLSGPLPSWIGSSWKKVQYLILINGKITGEFPPSLCNCKEMISLRLFNNSMKGEIPNCICNMRKLVDMEVSDNQFTGQIPDIFNECKNLENLYFSRNNFSGTFPPSLGHAVNLTVLDVSGNELYGTIPNTINNLKETIAEFAISYNMFSDIESGVDDFFKRIVDYTCLFYNNPWSCPLSTSVPKECTASCDSCNAKANHGSCSACLQATGCGWCQKGQNCLKGSNQGPEDYMCDSGDWKMSSC